MMKYMLMFTKCFAQPIVDRANFKEGMPGRPIFSAIGQPTKKNPAFFCFVFVLQKGFPVVRN